MAFERNPHHRNVTPQLAYSFLYGIWSTVMHNSALANVPSIYWCLMVCSRIKPYSYKNTAYILKLRECMCDNDAL